MIHSGKTEVNVGPTKSKLVSYFVLTTLDAKCVGFTHKDFSHSLYVTKTCIGHLGVLRFHSTLTLPRVSADPEIKGSIP